MAPAQQGNQTLAISPSLIVGIVILAAFALVIIIASVCRFCCGDGPRKGKNRSASIQYEGAANGGIDVFNPNRPRSAEQLARMQQVRWINNMYAWERGRQARMEIGELKPDDAHLGHNRNWGDWSSIGDNSSGSASGSRSRGQSEIHPVEDPSGTASFYNLNLDNPYDESSSRQRLNYLAPPTSARNSYQTSSSVYSSCRQSSVLLPPALFDPRDLVPGSPSPLYREYQRSGPEQQNHPYSNPTDGVHTPERMQTPPLQQDGAYASQNPRIIINDNHSEDIVAALRSPVGTHHEEDDFEAVDLNGGHQVEEESGDNVQVPSELARPRSRSRRTVSFLIGDGGRFPPFQIQAGPSRQSQASVSVYDDDNGKVHALGDENDDLVYDLRGINLDGRVDIGNGKQPARSDLDSGPQSAQQRDRQGSHDGVKTLIQEWEKVNGRFGRNF